MDRLFDLLHRSAESGPARPVFVSSNHTTSYAELDGATSRLAGALRRMGVSPGDRVVLMLDACVEYLVAYYGVLKAGAIAVPVAPDARGRALAGLFAHCGAVALVAGPEAATSLALDPLVAPTLALAIGVRTALPPGGYATAAFAALAAEPAPLDDPGTRDTDVATIHYTSGTTGRPKGAMITHRNLVANARSIIEYLALGPDDVAAMVLPFHYVYGSSVLHTHVAAGGTIVLAGSLAFPTTILAAIQRHRCTGLAGVPSTFAKITSLPLDRYDLGSLRYLTAAGAALPSTAVGELRARLPHARLFLMYGQTEATARLTYLPPELLDAKAGSAGKAIPGVTLAICDADGRELPRGTVGEIVARGDNIMKGYWNDPEETARVLRPEGLRTGDLARMDEDGYLFITGRASEMIKTGGRRVSPLEIEEVLLAVPGIRECAVVGEPDALLGEAIVAHVVLDPHAPIDEQAVQRACLRELPRAKVPARVHFVGALPRTPNGKLRRRDLRTSTPIER